MKAFVKVSLTEDQKEKLKAEFDRSFDFINNHKRFVKQGFLRMYYQKYTPESFDYFMVSVSNVGYACHEEVSLNFLYQESYDDCYNVLMYHEEVYLDNESYDVLMEVLEES